MPFNERPEDEDLRECVRAIKRGDAKEAIFSLQRFFGDRNAYQVIKTEWRRK